MSEEHEGSVCIGHEACPSCRGLGNDNSGDNLARYSDGHGYCFACNYHEQGNGVITKKETRVLEWTPLAGERVALSQRRLREDIIKKFNYRVADHPTRGKVHVADYYWDGKLVAQHTRGKDKDFKWAGSTTKLELFGQHLWKNDGRGKRLIITEGEIDALSVCQSLNGTWPVVSVPNGADSALKYVLQNLEFVDSYPEIVLCFDMDGPGQKAAQEIAETLKPGKCKIVTLPEKDASDCLMKNKSQELVNALYEAKVYSPDEILHVSQVVQMTEDHNDQKVYPFPFDVLSEFLIGQRTHEITLWCSGTGSGKSTVLREMAFDHLEAGRSVGLIMLEESPQETMDDMISLLLAKPVRSIRATRMMNELRAKMGKPPIHVDIIDDLTDEEYADAQRKLAATSLYIYDHLGNNAMACLLARMEYMAVSLGVDVIVLDHITAAAAGLMGINDKDFDGGASERIIIDSMMKDMRSLCVRTGVHIDIVSQLKKTDRAFEEGARITLQDLRGSGALASVPNTVIALERDRQNDDEIVANTTIVRVLKNRLTGRSGVATCLYFDRRTNKLQEVEWTRDERNNLVVDPGFQPVV